MHFNLSLLVWKLSIMVCYFYILLLCWVSFVFRVSHIYQSLSFVRHPFISLVSRFSFVLYSTICLSLILLSHIDNTLVLHYSAFCHFINRWCRLIWVMALKVQVQDQVGALIRAFGKCGMPGQERVLENTFTSQNQKMERLHWESRLPFSPSGTSDDLRISQ